MIACGIGVLKGQQDYSPGQSEATPWVCGIISNFSLFLFRAGADAGAKQEKGKWGWMGRFPRAPVAATSALGYGLVAPAGRHGRTKSLQATAATASVDRFMNFEHLCCSRHGGYGGCA